MTDNINAGIFRKRIRIEKPAFSTNSSGGGGTPTWSLVVDRVPARFVYATPSKKGDEAFSQQQVQSFNFVEITIRYRPSLNIDSSMRIVFGTRSFNIRTVVPVDEAQHIITLQCEELQAKGTLNI